ncbi:hypothetical protein GCM10010280_66950 [Streptomyces pilosus]|uniref:Uncharacterized protein n=1 Tax=Streptomyces pilosus TaxID=28893 RepID=A0A918F565_9ACTN|nr:hypothetical protein GCM10010280_66950 [Streptomyces pilosus]
MKAVALCANPARIRRNGNGSDSPLSPETGRSHLQESLFAWLAPEPGPRAPGPGTSRACGCGRDEDAPAFRPRSPPAPPIPEEKPDLSHAWVTAAEVEVTPKTARVADFRASFKAVLPTRGRAAGAGGTVPLSPILPADTRVFRLTGTRCSCPPEPPLLIAVRRRPARARAAARAGRRRTPGLAR